MRQIIFSINRSGANSNRVPRYSIDHRTINLSIERMPRVFVDRFHPISYFERSSVVLFVSVAKIVTQLAQCSNLFSSFLNKRLECASLSTRFRVDSEKRLRPRPFE